MKTSPNYRCAFNSEIDYKYFKFLEKGFRYRFTLKHNVVVQGCFDSQTQYSVFINKGTILCNGNSYLIDEEFGYHFNKTGVILSELISLK